MKFAVCMDSKREKAEATCGCFPSIMTCSHLPAASGLSKARLPALEPPSPVAEECYMLGDFQSPEASSSSVRKTQLRYSLQLWCQSLHIASATAPAVICRSTFECKVDTRPKIVLIPLSNRSSQLPNFLVKPLQSSVECHYLQSAAR